MGTIVINEETGMTTILVSLLGIIGLGELPIATMTVSRSITNSEFSIATGSPSCLIHPVLQAPCGYTAFQ